MNTKPERTRNSKNAAESENAADAPAGNGSQAAASSAGARKRPGGLDQRRLQYMISPAGYGLGGEQLTKFLHDFGGIEVLRTLAARGPACPPVAAVRAAPETIALLHRQARSALVIELDELLRAAAPRLAPHFPAPPVAHALGPGFTTIIQVRSESGDPVAGAEVHLLGLQWTAQGMTDGDGKATLTLFGELPETVMQLLVKPRAGHWGFWISQPELKKDAVNLVSLRSLPEFGEAGWASQAMRLDRLPAEWRGAGVKIALIDSGVARSHPNLRGIEHGFDAAYGEIAPWFEDPIGHGTPGAGIIVAASDSAEGLRGYAPDAELHVCKLGPAARSSDLVAALDYCVQAGIDAGCLGFGCQERSIIVEQRIVAAKEQGMALIAAAGSTGGPVQYPARSPHVLAIGAIGQLGTFPDGSPQAAQTLGAFFSGEFFVPAFTCAGPEVDLCAPGVSVISCQSPGGYAAGDGTSLAVCHVAALAALVLAHRADFQREFSNKNFRRVERLFQILKESALPLGLPAQTGAGLPDASLALGLTFLRTPSFMPSSLGLKELREALQAANLTPGGRSEVSGGAAEAPLQAMTGTDKRIHALKAAMRHSGLAQG